MRDFSALKFLPLPVRVDMFWQTIQQKVPGQESAVVERLCEDYRDDKDPERCTALEMLRGLAGIA